MLSVSIKILNLEFRSINLDRIYCIYIALSEIISNLVGSALMMCRCMNKMLFSNSAVSRTLLDKAFYKNIVQLRFVIKYPPTTHHYATTEGSTHVI